MSKHYYSNIISNWARIAACSLSLIVTMACPILGAPMGGDLVPDEEEYRALMAFFESTHGEKWDHNDNWGNGTTSDAFEQWYGVVVKDGDVVGIELTDNNLHGVFPDEFVLLSELRVLAVSTNHIANPPDFERLPHLQRIDLSFNAFSGDTPGSIGSLQSLQYLNLSQNQFTGPILQQLQGCISITEVYLSGNLFAGTIPPFRQSFWPNLRVLDISGNAFTGALPVTIPITGSCLPDLEELYLASNQLSGSIPPELHFCSSLRVLDVSYNKLSGPIPQELATMPALQSFFASYNQLTSVPDFQSAPYLNSLLVDVSYNSICFGPLETNATGPSSFRPATYEYQGQIMPDGEVTEKQSVAEPIVLTCSFSGKQNTYAWFKKNVAGTWQVITGATNAVYRIEHPTLADAGRYACQVANNWLTPSTNLYLWTQTTNIVLTTDNTYSPPSQPADDRDRNWTIERTYDGVDNNASNVLAESKQFTDGLGRVTQAQARSRANSHVFASQTIYSTGGQPVLQTLAAPIDNQSFAYKENFAAVTVGGQSTAQQYAPINFEGPKADNPDALDTQTRGTLGYYFSTNNELEPLTPATSSPYSLTEPSEGPLGGIRRAAAPGDAFRMGSAHEGRGRDIPLLNEFDHYMSLRHHFVPSSNNLVTLKAQGSKTISIDADGRESIVLSNKDGQALVSCLTNANYAPVSIQAFISTDPTNTYDASAPRFRDIHIPATGEHQLDFTVAGKVRVIKLNNEAGVSLTAGGPYADSVDVTVQPSPNSQNGVRTPVYLRPGFYRLISLPSTVTGEKTQWFNYQAEYGNFSYTYYDDAGRVVATVAPNGLENIAQLGGALPSFVTRSTYDTSNRLLSTESAEDGRTDYVYAKDGRIRFSQSALQRPAGRFSYSNYDEIGRVVESGEYTPTPAGPVFQNLLPASTMYRAEASTDRGGGVQLISNGGSNVIGNFNQSGAYIAFNVSVPITGTYAVRIRYAAGDNAFQGRTMPLYLQNAQSPGYLYHVTFPTTYSWNTWDVQTLQLNLTQGANRILFQQDRPNSDPAHEGYVNFDYCEVVSEQAIVPSSVLNLLEERAPTNSLLAANCGQRNFVTYDQVFTGSGSTAEPLLAGRTQEFTIGAVSKTQNDHVTTWYSYDELGRVAWVVQNIEGLGAKTLDYKYDIAGNVLEVAYQHGQPDAFHHYYEYDQAQRLYKVYTSPDGTERTLQAKYFYYLHGPLKRVEVANRLQGIDYTYTLQGWLKSINHVNLALDPGGDSPAGNGVPKDLFSLTLDYFTGDYQSRNLNVMTPTGLASTSNPFRYDGTIRAATWRTAASPDRHQFLYQYDAKSQFVGTTYGNLGISGAYYHFDAVANNPYSERGMNYDPNGNIKSLLRSDKIGQTTDNFSYQYTAGTNRLSAVHGGGSPTGPTVLSYEYDALGQMTHEQEGSQDRYMRYDVTGKVTGVYKSTTNQYAIATFTYDDKGFRSTKVTHDEDGDIANTTTYVRDVAGNVLSVYESNYGNRYTPTRTEVPLYGSGRIGVLTHLDDGTTTGRDEARYELNDHLGDARVVFHRPTTTAMTASFELTQQALHEDSEWSGIAQARRYSSSAHQGVTTPSNYVAYVAPPVAGGRTVGVYRTVNVAKGDTLTFSAWTYLFATGTASSRPSGLRVIPLLVPGANVASNQPAVTQPDGLPAPAARQSWLSRVAAGIALVGWGGKSPATANIGTGGGSTFSSQVWLRYRVLDENGNLVDEQFTYLTAAQAQHWQQLSTGVRVQQAGSVFVAIGSDDPSWQAYFDDLRLEQTDGLIVQEQHQYAYGSPLVGLNYAVGNKRYRYGYQGQFAEKDGETSFESFELRMYNSRIGKWTSYDPKGQFDSPYVGMGNNPVSSVDPDGGFTCCGGHPPGVVYANGFRGAAKVTTKVAARTTVSSGTRAAIGAGLRTTGQTLLRAGKAYGEYAQGFGSAVFNDVFGGAPDYIASRYGASSQPYSTPNAVGQTVGHAVGTAFGIVSTGLGLLGDGGGMLLSATGVGAVGGVPLTVASVVVTGYGAAVTKSGALGALNSGKSLLNMGKFKPEQEGGFHKNPQGNNTKINEQFKSLCQQYGLTKNEQRILHEYITGRGLTRQEIEAELKELFNK